MNEKLIEKISSLYNIKEINNIQKVDKGFLSENYKFESGDREYFLKKYRFKNEDRIKEIHSVKNYFSEGGVPVIMPIKNKDNQYYFEHDGAYYTLFPFVTGIQPERGELSNEMIISLGKMLGKIHLLGRDSKLVINDYFSVPSKKESLETVDKIQEKLNEIKNKNDFDLLALKVVSFKKDLIQKSDVKFDELDLKSDHLVHGDYLYFNVFFDENSEIKYVFDFEKTSYEPRTQELFRSVTYSFLNTDFDDTSIENIKLYIESYLEVYPMDQTELKNGLLAHYIKSIHSFWVEKEHYLKGSNRVDLFLELNYNRIKFMTENMDQFELTQDAFES